MLAASASSTASILGGSTETGRPCYEQDLFQSKVYQRATLRVYRRRLSLADASTAARSSERARSCNGSILPSPRDSHSAPSAREAPRLTGNDHLEEVTEAAVSENLSTTHHCFPTQATMSSPPDSMFNKESILYTTTTQLSSSSSSPVTTQSSAADIANDVCLRLTLSVEVADVGSREMLLDQLDKDNSFDYIMSVASSIRNDIIRAAKKSSSKIEYRLVESQVSASKRGSNVLSSPFNSGFLAGALEELAGGTYDHVLVITKFAPELPDLNVEGIKATLTGRPRKTEDGNSSKAVVQYASIDAILSTGRMTTASNTTPSKLSSKTFDMIWLSPDLPDVVRHKIQCNVQNFRLPWTEEKVIARGGSSVVYRVKLTPDHHVEEHIKGNTEVASTCFFALKSIGRQYEDMFRQEVEVLKRLSSFANSRHIVKLLMAFEQVDRLQLMFPYADGDLRDFWRSHKPTSCIQLAIWMTDQLHGLAAGLHSIHNIVRHGIDSDSEPDPLGRHGDIKPDNILWFKSPQTRSMGTLVITDFGLSRISHSAKTTRRRSTKVLRTVEYSAPDSNVSSCYDMWSFGCTLLEFLTWYLLGLRALDDYHRDRYVRQARPGAVQ